MKPVWLLYLLAFTALSVRTTAEGEVDARGGRVGWARIVTSNSTWNRHAQSDPTLTSFIRRQTSLNIDPTWYSADPGAVDQLTRYPLLFANNLTDVRGTEERKNLREYLQRGGFIFIDACSNHTVTRDPDAFLSGHIALMKTLAPKAEVRVLPPTHEIYRQYFVMKDTPPHTYMSDDYDPKWARHGLYGVFEGDRLIALISLSGLQCGWSGTYTRQHAEECMKMVVNIYVYAMTR